MIKLKRIVLFLKISACFITHRNFETVECMTKLKEIVGVNTNATMPTNTSKMTINYKNNSSNLSVQPAILPTSETFKII